MGLVVKRFTAPWCGPCRMLAPIIDELMFKKPSVTFETIDVDEDVVTSKKYEVRSIPLVIIEKDGEIVETIIGAKPESTYIALIEKWI